MRCDILEMQVWSNTIYSRLIEDYFSTGHESTKESRLTSSNKIYSKHLHN